MTARIAAAKWPLILVGATVVAALLVALFIALLTAYANYRAHAALKRAADADPLDRIARPLPAAPTASSAS